MPVNPTYPGVYIQELPSGSRTISGVATSITAFVGRAKKGPVSDATTINNFGDYERRFGGLWVSSPMSYAVQQFFRAGGGQAIIVRVVDTTAGTGTAAKASVTLGTGAYLRLRANASGSSGALLRAEIAQSTSPNDQFTLTLYSTASPSDTEVYTITMNPDDGVDVDSGSGGGPYYIADLAQVLVNAGSVARVTDIPYERPDDTGTGGEAFALASASATYATAALGATQSSPTNDSLVLQAVSEGAWGNDLQVSVSHDVGDPDDLSTFNLIIEELDDDGNVVQTETFRNLTFDPDEARYVATVLEEESKLVEVYGAVPALGTGADWYSRPDEVTDSPLTGGDDGGVVTDLDILGSESAKTGLYALLDADLFNLVVIPPPSPDTDFSSWSTVIGFCEDHRAVVIVDPPSTWTTKDDATEGMSATSLSDLSISASSNAAMYFPYVRIPDPLRENRLADFPPAAVVAGVIAKTDADRGIWKAPAGLDARLRPVRSLKVALTDAENGELNPLGLNCLRSMPAVGPVVWGTRTLEGSDRLASEWKYLPVRRLALYIQESLYRGTQWVVFEPNDEPLWSQIRLSVGSFMQTLFRQGAFQGSSPSEAYFVKCDSETTTQDDIDRGIVNILVGFAPLKPAEFVIISLQQIAGQSAA
ncbi:MAG: phage tail sheath subtilisin-like domain-containing protein [Alphaproteobacteria bacterium]|nr:phage tail sheath subtilisin-like domain-containing protein [Alphaproteobacteria bacterium]